MVNSSLSPLNNIKPLQAEDLFFLAEKMGFEPVRDLHLLVVFETTPFNRLGTSPKRANYIIRYL